MIEKTYNFLIKSLVYFYTALLRQRLGNCGRLTRIHPPCRVTEGAGVAIGDDVTIMEGVWLNAKQTATGLPSLVIGDNSYIGRFCHINAIQSVVIEPEVLIADRVYISDEEHVFSRRDLPIIRQGTRFKGPVTLQSGCWIGEGASILPGITIGKNAIVAAGAVVTRSVVDFSIVGGVPARQLSSQADGSTGEWS